MPRFRSAYSLVVFGAIAGCTPPPHSDLLFQATLPGDSEDIYRLSLDSGASERVTHGSSEFANSFPAGSPVDGRVAFVRQRREGPDSLFLLAADARVIRAMSAPELPVLGPPAWSPDGSSLLVPAGEDESSKRLFLVDVDGSAATELPLPEGTFDCGTFSAGGDRIVASRRIGSASQVVVFDFPRATSATVDVLLRSDSLHFHCPEWSRVADVIGITTYSLDYSRAELGLIDLAIRSLRGLDAGPGYNNAMKWSPNGTLIAYQCTEGTPQDSSFYDRMEVCVVRPDGTGRRQLTRNAHFDAHPSW